MSKYFLNAKCVEIDQQEMKEFCCDQLGIDFDPTWALAQNLKMILAMRAKYLANEHNLEYRPITYQPHAAIQLNPHYGICYHLPFEQLFMFNNLCTKWQWFSGDRAYPVGTGRDQYHGIENQWMVQDKDPVWAGDYIHQRFQMVRWAISYLEGLLK